MLSDDRPPTINAEKMLPVLTYRLRPATDEDVGFLADVVIEATQAQGRLPNDFDERNWRNGFAEWTMEQVRGEIPDSTTSVVEVDNERVGRLRIVRTAECIELSGIQLLPGIQRHGIGTAIIKDYIGSDGIRGLIPTCRLRRPISSSRAPTLPGKPPDRAAGASGI
jgi:hypothetical protein